MARTLLMSIIISLGKGLKGLLNFSESPKQNEPNLSPNLDKIKIKIKEIEVL